MLGRAVRTIRPESEADMSFLPRNGGGNGIVWPSHGAYIGPMTAVFQSSLPYDPVPKKLPGIAPMAMADWLMVDDAFAGQMAERDRLLAERRQDVLALDPAARDAAAELLDLVLSLAYPGFGAEVTRPDGVRIAIDRTDPMGTLGRLVQDWAAYLATGLSLEERETLRQHERTGRPLGDEAFVERLERIVNRPLKKRKPGPTKGRGTGKSGNSGSKSKR